MQVNGHLLVFGFPPTERFVWELSIPGKVMEFLELRCAAKPVLSLGRPTEVNIRLYTKQFFDSYMDEPGALWCN